MRQIIWLGSSKKDLLKSPKAVIQEIGYALYLAQNGERYTKAKAFKGCGSGVYEIAIEYDKNAYRSIYVAGFENHIYVVHCFQKKSKRAIKTPKEEIAVVKQRLKQLKQMMQEK